MAPVTMGCLLKVTTRWQAKEVSHLPGDRVSDVEWTLKREGVRCTVPGRAGVHGAVCTGESQAEQRSTVPCTRGQDAGALGGLLSHVHFGCLTFKHPHCAVAGGGAGEPRAARRPCRQRAPRSPLPRLCGCAPSFSLGDSWLRASEDHLVLTANVGTMGNRFLLQRRKLRVREVRSPRSHGQPGDVRLRAQGCGPGPSPFLP